MAGEGYVLSESDVRELRQLLSRARSGSLTTAGRGRDVTLDTADLPAPEVHVARTPPGGIPALSEGADTGTGTGTGGGLSDDSPGSATCSVYQILPGTDLMSPINGYTLDVWNVSTTAVPGDSWVVVKRDRFGRWLADAPPAGVTLDVVTNVCPVVEDVVVEFEVTSVNGGTW